MSGEANKLAEDMRSEYEANLRDLATGQQRLASQLERLAVDPKGDEEKPAEIEELIENIRQLQRKYSAMERWIRMELQKLDALVRAASEMTQDDQEGLDRMLREDGQK